MKYYIIENNQSVGPFEVRELLAKGIKATDLVWCEGMSQWAAASTIPEITTAMNADNVPPFMPEPASAVYNMPESTIEQLMPNTWLVTSIVVTLFCCCPVGIAAIIQAARVEPLWRNKHYDEAQKASSNAKKWTFIALACGLLFYILYIACMTAFASYLQEFDL
ncbi:MAG: CD225/dispanin family protein [Muribaculum sp.]|nr:CD225/dispanin family protein [Muribaculaceae bacterium]MCM1081768.1 CD225/dispanin family protein [Muribaculum sp.]